MCSASTFCIVQFGRATAFPHGLPGDQHLAEGEMVLIDTGTQIDGYNSDITRTYAFGTVGAHEHDIWALEKAAQAAAFAAIPGYELVGGEKSGGSDDADKAALLSRAEAVKLGVKNNWSLQRLTAEVEKAEAEAAAAAAAAGKTE